mgnify:FL=1|tara:strand:+ start:1003 stop:1716 length:714 start_codon:yes stop_codon:yes gene_type:complete
MTLSIIIPCKNEEDLIYKNLYMINNKIKKSIKKYQIIIVNDFSEDNTLKIARKFAKNFKNIIVRNNKIKGLGGAINLGIKVSSNKFVCIMMADLSDSPRDLIKYYNIISTSKLDAVFGSRFTNGSRLIDYPVQKLIYNRIFNYFVKIFFLSDYNDFTNAFKIYKKQTLRQIGPFISENFNIFLELPLKIIIRKKKYKIVPISWRNRKKGLSKFKVKELSSKYFFTLLYCFIEKILIR